MTNFLQFHLLTVYGPSNPNRDDQGRPKAAMVGGEPRLRLSSQSVKRAIRESAFFALDLKDHQGLRTKRLFEKLKKKLIEDGGVTCADGKKISPERAHLIAELVATIFGGLEKSNQKASDGGEEENRQKEEKNLIAKTLAFISPAEWRAAEELAVKLAGDSKSEVEKPANQSVKEQEKQEKEHEKFIKAQAKELKDKVLQKADGAVDIAMFGRMLADDADFNREAAVQVSHAITTHRAIAQEDWFSAVDDLNKAEETGAGHLGEHGFGSGVYYQYVCVNVDLLTRNLAGDRELAAKGLEALARALAEATPRGKQNSHAHHPRAFYIRAERGDQQPRDLTGAFFKAVDPRGGLDGSIAALEETARKIDRAYGQGYADLKVLNIPAEIGTLEEIAAFAAAAAAEA